MKKMHAATIMLNELPVYEAVSFLDILAKPSSSFFDKPKSNLLFKKLAKEVYYPTLNLLLTQNIGTNIIISGYFLQQAAEHYPKLLLVLRKLLAKDLVYIVANAYFGEDLSMVYNTNWWSHSLQKTCDKVKELLNYEVEGIFLSQMYRNLELERFVHKKRITKFILRQKGKKYSSFYMNLSELRRFNGQTVSWINNENDVKCHFNFIPDTDFFNINGNIFQPNLEQAAKTFAFAVAFTASEFKIRKNTKKIRSFTSLPRINEKPSLTLLSSLEKATLRLWDYGLTRLLNLYNDSLKDEWPILLQNFVRLQNTDFFAYLNKSNYLLKDVENFSSPYEAFVSMQAKVKQVEMLLQKK